MSRFNTLVFIVAYDKPHYTSKVLDCFLKSKQVINTKLILIDNSKYNSIVNDSYFDYPKIIHFKTKLKNKSSALNQATHEFCKNYNDFVVCLDNDVEFNDSFLKKYIEAAQKNGSDYYYGTSFKIKNKPEISPLWVKRYLQGSQLGKSDEGFKKNNMFLGFSFAFFKVQWLNVYGFDERFGPGSKFNLGSQESTFQKKLKHKGYKPFLIKNNPITHKPLESSYEIKYVLKRVSRNGRTHGFESLINDKSIFKIKFLNKLFLNSYSLVISLFQIKKDVKFKLYYLVGLVQSIYLYMCLPDKKSLYESDS